MSMECTGTAAITGTDTGLGLGLVAECARRGFDVLAAVLDPASADRVREAGAGLPGAVTVEVLDVTAPGTFRFPDDLRVLVNNAGIRLAYLPIEETPAEDWRRVFDVNFFGAVEMARRAIPVLRAGGGGVICNINSGSLVAPIPFLGTYRSAKAALAGFSEVLRTEVAPFGIRVVEILPGPIETNINTDSIMRRVADAVAFDAYAPMARRQRELNAHAPTAISVAEAARAVVDAIVDEGGPMRYGTSPESNAALEAWRHSTDEELMVPFIERLVGETRA
jgi:NAD(P)-dependent dehydrogenase (short-subunit alcohol dehydrogenase family)